MVDRPIIFSASMVRALLDGRKTQTRRVLKPQPSGIAQAERIAPKSWRIFPESDRCSIDFKAPPYAPGDRLWVRETWCRVSDNPMSEIATLASGDGIAYRATDDDEMSIPPRWRSPIFMPRWASRLTLTVTDVRLQRLQEISEADALAEGIQPFGPVFSVEKADGFTACGTTARAAFATLWNSLHGPDAWNANPWVAAISFTVQRGNIDQIGGDNG